MRDPGRSIAIVTTASLPWMTGTSVNPLLRAAYLARDGTRRVTLLLPWLAPSDQLAVHPGHTFSTPAEQTAYVREWVADRVGFAPDIKFTFYPGRWAPDKCSILPVGDITAYVPDAEADVAVLEEPEHLTWYHHGVRWTDKFAHVVGVVHTNYLEYARREENGGVKEAVLRFVNSWVVRAYCHKVVKLSDAVQQLPRAQTCFVHGVSPRFLSIGEQRAQRFAPGRGLNVEHYSLLVAIEREEDRTLIAGERRSQRAGPVTLGRLDLDDLCTEVTKLHRGHRPGHALR